MQTRIGSFVESCVNIGLGYGVAIVSQVAVFPMFDIHVPLRTNLWIGAWFTGISLVRSYAIRRCFNWRLHRRSVMPYFLYRPTPMHDWHVTTERPIKNELGSIIDLPDCHWFSQAQAEEDRLNGKGSAQQESLPI